MFGFPGYAKLRQHCPMWHSSADDDFLDDDDVVGDTIDRSCAGIAAIVSDEHVGWVLMTVTPVTGCAKEHTCGHKAKRPLMLLVEIVMGAPVPSNS